MESIIDYESIDLGSTPSRDLFYNHGVVAQMVERTLCMREVEGSMPFNSINFYFNKIYNITKIIFILYIYK